MNNVNISLIIFPILLILSMHESLQNASAETAVDVEQISIGIADNQKIVRHGRRRSEKRSIIYDYMLANGDITQAQLDSLTKNGKRVKAELAALHRAGNKRALAARVAELRTQREADKEELRAYVEAHPDLAEAIAAWREKVKGSRYQHGKQNFHGRDAD